MHHKLRSQCLEETIEFTLHDASSTLIWKFRNREIINKQKKNNYMKSK